MREITKGKEPKSLTEYRTCQTRPLETGIYDDYQHKDQLRHALVTEQKGLCCYCSGRIKSEWKGARIEHWRAQSKDKYPDQQLDYPNLLAACNGNEGQPPEYQHCDVKKGDQDLKWNPANPGHQIESRIYYDNDGSIRAEDLEFNQQIREDVLNLNLPFLMNRRRAVLRGMSAWLRFRKAKLKGPISDGTLEKEIAKRTDAEILEPYSPVAVWWLRKKLTRRQRK